MIPALLFALQLTAPGAEYLACEDQEETLVREWQVTLPYRIEVRALAGQAAVLVVEERGVPLRLLLAAEGESTDLQDLPPDGRSLEAVVVEPGSSIRLHLEASGDETEAPVRLELSCHLAPFAPGLAALRALQSASVLLARAESDAPASDGLRLQASSRLEEVLRQAPSARWPWLTAAAHHGLAFLDGRRNRLLDAAGQYAAAAQAWRDLGDPLRASWARLRESQQWRRVSQIAPALTASEQAQVLAKESGDVSLQLAVATDACLLQRLARSAAGARDCWRRILPLAERHARPGDLATLLANYADVQISLGELETAQKSADLALAHARRSESRRSLLLALVVRGRLSGLQVKAQDALAHFAEAQTLAVELNDLPMLANSRLQLAQIWTLLEQPRRAIAAATEARDTYARLGNAARSAQAALLVEALHTQTEDNLPARVPGSVLVQLVQDLPLRGEHPLSARLLAIDLCLRRGDADCARSLLTPLANASGLPYVQACKLGLAQARLALLDGNPDTAIAGARVWQDRALLNGDLPTLLDALWVRGRAEARAKRTQVAWRTLQELIDGALRLSRLQAYPFHRQQLLERARGAFALQLELRPPADSAPLSRSELPVLLELLASPRPPLRIVSEAALQAQARLNLLMQQHWQLDVGVVNPRKPSIALDESLPLDAPPASKMPVHPRLGAWYGFMAADAVHWWQLRGDRVLHRQSRASPARLLAMRDALQEQLRSQHSDSDEVQRLAKALAEASGFTKIAAESNVEELQVALPDLLAALPLSLLMPSRLDGISPVPVVVLEPVIGGAGPVPCCADLKLLAVADPVPASGQGASLARLPGAREEARRVVLAWPAAHQTLLLGIDAAADTVLQALASTVTVVHIGTHGLVERDGLELSGLLIVDTTGNLRVLGAVELLSARLAAPLVVLSACDGGLPLEVSPTTTTSLARILLRAGASRVIAASWKVDDAAAAELMFELYQGLARGTTPALALQGAQAAMRESKRYGHPYYWAGFQLLEAAPL